MLAVSAQTVLDEDTQALLDQERGVEHNKSEAERKHIVAPPNFQKASDGTLGGILVSEDYSRAVEGSYQSL